MKYCMSVKQKVIIFFWTESSNVGQRETTGFTKELRKKKKEKKNFLNKEAVAMCKYQPLLSRNFYMQINYCLSEFPLHLLVDFRKLEFSSK